MENMKNRFASVGVIMTGDSYVPRKLLEKKLLERTVNYDDYAPVNVVGLQRMGKSSLVYNTFVAKADEFYKKNIVVVYISANEFNSANLFFNSMATNVYRVIKKHGNINDEIKETYDEYIEQNNSDRLRFFFQSIKDSGKRVVLIIDEFDAVTNFFSSNSFGVLRQLAYQPETHVAFVFVSRRLFKELEIKCAGASPANNILDCIHVKGFSDEEMQDYFRLNKDSGVDLSEDEQKKLIEITGGQPFWSDLILKAYKEAKENNENTDLETLFNEKIDKIHGEFQHTLDLLEDQGLLNKLYQIVFGPMEPDCEKADIQTLYNYGIIVDKDKSTVISDKFYDYMKTKEREVNFYPLWHETETGLRKILKSKLEKQYQKEWEAKILALYRLSKPEGIMKVLDQDFLQKNEEEPWEYNGEQYTKKQYFLSDNLDKAFKQKKKMLREKEIKEDVIITLLEAMLTRGLFLLYDFEYDKLNLGKIFGDKDKFVEKSLHLSDARNPYQHNNDELLTDEYKKKTKEYCEALYNSIKEFLENQK